jgi:DNA/RNA endonuclease YhcR with UshA esterase domain
MKEFSELLLLASIGILLLSFTATGKPEKSEIQEISKSDVGGKVLVEASVSQAFRNDGNTFLDLKGETGNISAVDFDARKNYVEGDRVLAIGRVEIYQGKRELIVKESSIVPS